MSSGPSSRRRRQPVTDSSFVLVSKLYSLHSSYLLYLPSPGALYMFPNCKQYLLWLKRGSRNYWQQIALHYFLRRHSITRVLEIRATFNSSISKVYGRNFYLVENIFPTCFCLAETREHDQQCGLLRMSALMESSHCQLNRPQ